MSLVIPRANECLTVDIASERALIMYVKDRSDMSGYVKAFLALLKARGENAETQCCYIKEIIPSYHSLLVTFDPLRCDHQLLIDELLSLALSVDVLPSTTNNIIRLPVYYDEQYGLDLSLIAERAKLSIHDVIQLHQQTTYQVKSIGFAPGFAYLGDVDPSIAMPRLSTPRMNVPKGAVAIANNQTAVYPQASPGGWNIIGLCPTTLFDAQSQTLPLFEVGDSVQFYAIDKAEFIHLGGELPTLDIASSPKKSQVKT